MPTPTYDLIASNVLSSSASSITFSSIPATYRDLVLVVRGTTAINNGERVQFNGDTTGSNYSVVAAVGYGTSAASNTDAGAWLAYNLAAGDGLLSIVQIMDYSATDKHKTSLHRGNSPTVQGVEMMAQRWANTTAINQVTVLAVGTTWNSGSTFHLYGIVS